ncbi:MAG TPA: glycosyltransferase family 2 protein [Rhodospirillaceae bacterium]|nr:glycosyl transferase [Rhodospirillaceae bacterium]HAT34475.1 glycosyltransferase family 2 protein [Rhodospirillaceae bacterium]
MPAHSFAGPLISVIVVNYNSGNNLIKCLKMLAAQNFEHFEAIVLDNGSSDGSFQTAIGEIKDNRFRFDKFECNLGFAAASNRGASLAQGPWIACLNPDAFPEQDWLRELWRATQHFPDADMFGSVQILADQPGLLDGDGDVYFCLGLSWRGGYRQKTGVALPDGEIFSPCAAAALYRRERFLSLNGFCEDFFCYMEDVDLAFRWRLAGGRAIQVSRAVVQHVGGASGGRPPTFARFHGVRNAIWTYFRNMPGPLFWLLLPGHAGLQIVLLAQGTCSGQFVATLSGILAAMRALPAIWRQRKKIQARATVPPRQIYSTLDWNPLNLLKRRNRRL